MSEKWEYIESRHSGGYRIRRILDRDRSEVIGQVNNENDARLVALAPEMLFALRAFAGNTNDRQAREDARAIIAKAERRGSGFPFKIDAQG